jgi:hypothetical protein
MLRGLSCLRAVVRPPLSQITARLPIQHPRIGGSRLSARGAPPAQADLWVRIKLDDNIRASAATIATQLGHDTETVVGENLTGATDADVLGRDA